MDAQGKDRLVFIGFLFPEKKIGRGQDEKLQPELCCIQSFRLWYTEGCVCGWEKQLNLQAVTVDVLKKLNCSFLGDASMKIMLLP